MRVPINYNMVHTIGNKGKYIKNVAIKCVLVSLCDTSQGEKHVRVRAFQQAFSSTNCCILEKEGKQRNL